MNKTIIATALGCAFSISATAAEVTIGGDYAWGHTNTNGAKEAATDADINFVATEELANGMTVSADFNFDQDGADDGDSSLTVAGTFGSLDVGDTSSATDAIDDVTDWGYFRTSGTDDVNHSVLYTLPTLVEGLTVNASYAPDTNDNSNPAGTAYSVSYDAGVAKVGYGVLNNDDNTEATLYNVSAVVAGVSVGYEVYTVTDANDVDTDDTAMSATYTIDKITLAYENVTTESAGTTSADTTAFGIHYAVGGGLTAFAETSEDDKTANSKATTIGLAYAF